MARHRCRLAVSDGLPPLGTVDTLLVPTSRGYVRFWRRWISRPVEGGGTLIEPVPLAVHTVSPKRGRHRASSERPALLKGVRHIRLDKPAQVG